MKRRDALDAACTLIAEVLPVVAHREDGSWQQVVGVEIDGIPGLQLSCVAHGSTRESERISVQPRVAGTSDELIPRFRDPPGQPEPLLDGPLLRRDGASYRWAADRAVLGAAISRASRARWESWRANASEMLIRGPTAWAEACERVAALDDPLRWLARADDADGVLASLALPAREAWERAHWVAAWIGFGRVIDRCMPCDPVTAARIARAAATVRASSLERH